MDKYSQVLQIPAREWNVRHHLDLAIANLGDIDGVAEVSHTPLNLDLVMQELFESREIENLVVDRLGTVDGVLGDEVSNEKGATWAQGRY